MPSKYILTNVWWDNTYTNVRCFASKEEQAGYFGIPACFNSSKEINFNFRKTFRTTQVVKSPNNKPFENFNYNYLIVQDNRYGLSNNCLFYFIVDFDFDNGGVVANLQLELDISQTYQFNYGLHYKNSFIRRAHLDRWVRNGEDLSFNFNEDSLLNLNEQIDANQRLVKIETPIITKDCNLNNVNETITKWLNDNIKAWEYVYLDHNHDFVYLKNLGGNTDSLKNLKLYITDYKSLSTCAPLYKGSKKIYVTYYDRIGTLKKTPLLNESIRALKSMNNDNEYIFKDEYSAVCPFNEIDFTRLSIDSDGNLIYNANDNFYNTLAGVDDTMFGNSVVLKNQSLSGSHLPDYMFITVEYATSNTTEILSLLYFVPKMPKYYISTDLSTNITRSAIVDNIRHMNFEPKLKLSNFCHIEVDLAGNQTYTYSYNTLMAQAPVSYFEITKHLSPSISLEMIKYYPRFSNIYTETSNKDIGGLISNEDNTLPLINSAYSTYLANNKNAWLQQVGIKSITDTFNAVRGGQIAGINPLVSLVTGEKALTDIAGNIVNYSLSMDNLKNSPSNINNASGGILLSLNNHDLQPRIKYYDAINCDKQAIFDYLYEYGYIVNRIGEINDYKHVRHYFNYIQADVDVVYCDNYFLNNEVKEKVKEIYKNGVRFWWVEMPTFDHNLENYEENLLEDL